MQGETGANPVRARRREVPQKFFSCPFAAKRGQAIGSNSEKVRKTHRVEIPVA